jgi:ABC-type multidrug transport system fused ATPase/permease subunit
VLRLSCKSLERAAVAGASTMVYSRLGQTVPEDDGPAQPLMSEWPLPATERASEWPLPATEMPRTSDVEEWASSTGESTTAASGKKEVVRWFLDSDEDSVLEVLRLVGKQRRSLVLKVAEEMQPSMSNGSHDDGLEGLKSRFGRYDHEYAAVTRNAPVLKFAAPIFFCGEREKQVELSVLRIGDCSMPTEVDYSTRDGTARAGVKYEAIRGRLKFARGETHKTFNVSLISDDSWAPLQEFHVELLSSNSQNACLDFGRRVPVQVIDSDYFPSGKHAAPAENVGFEDPGDDAPADGSDAALLIDYFKLNLRQPLIFRATAQLLLVEWARSLIFIIALFMQVFMVDYVLNDEVEHMPRYFWLAFVVTLQLGFCLWAHFWDYRSISWKTAGMSRTMLQSALLRIYLNHDPWGEQNQKISLCRRGELEMTINVMVPGLVKDGYMSAVSLISKVGKFALLLLFHLSWPLVFHRPFKPTGTLSCIIFPVLLLGFFHQRRSKIVRVLEKEQKFRSHLFNHVEMSNANYHLVSGYGSQSTVAEKFESLTRAYSDAVVHRMQVSTNNIYYANWCGNAVAAFYTFLGGSQVIAGTLGIGLFLANIAALLKMGEIWDGIYTNLLDMEMAVPSLRQVMRIMNLPLSVEKRMSFQRACTMKTVVMMKEEKSNTKGVGPPILTADTLPLQIKLKNGSISELHQGSLIAVLGRNGSGKADLLKVLGGVKFPARSHVGRFFIPSHLRLVHIESQPLFFPGTLLENLTFGVSADEPHDGSEERVLQVCRKLGLHQRLLSRTALAQTAFNWQEVLSEHELQLLSIARGFIANPNVLVMHTPTLGFDQQAATHVLTTMREFVDCKGVALDDSQRASRRPRTCIFSAVRAQGLKVADQVVFGDRNGFHEVEQDIAQEALDAMLLKAP